MGLHQSGAGRRFEEIDGPMLRQGLQGRRVLVSNRRVDWADEGGRGRGGSGWCVLMLWSCNGEHDRSDLTGFAGVVCQNSFTLRTDMPLPGEASAKVGLRYELLWTAYCLTKVMSGDYESIRFAPPGPEGEGVEFFVRTQTGTEYHQVKRQQTGKGYWSLSDLGSSGVLSDFYGKSGGASDRCVFVSTEKAADLEELSDRARGSNSWFEFKAHFVSNDLWSQRFMELNSRWGASSERDTYERVQRVEVETRGEKGIREVIEATLGTWINGNLKTATEVLAYLSLNRIHHELNSDDIWKHLKSRGFSRRQLAHDVSVLKKLSEMRNVYVGGLDRVGIGGEVVTRSQVKEILHVFDRDDDSNIVLLSGKAGVGKSSVISQTLAEVEQRAWPVACLRVDRLEPCKTPSLIGDQFDLPDSPVRVLASVADGGDCLLILDQLDAVSLASGRNPEFFDCIAAMISEAEHHPNMRVLAACREFDIDNDNRIRDLSGERGVAKRVTVDEFDRATVSRIVGELGFDAAKLNAKQLALFSLPIHLKLLSEVADLSRSQDEIQTSKDLFDRFWDHKLNELNARGIDAAIVHEVTNIMVENMNRREILFVSAHLLQNHRKTVATLTSENILVKDGPRLAFFHESFFDFMFARTTTDVDFDLLKYLLSRDQSLFLRSQVRQILVHQRDFYPPMAEENLKSILLSDDIRRHLKCHVLSLVGSFDDPTSTEWQIIEDLLASDLAPRVWSAIHGSVAWFDLLDSQGTIAQWLASSDEERVNRGFWLLDGIHKDRPDRCAEMLTPYIETSDVWDKRLRQFLMLSELSNNRNLFELALNVADSGVLDGAVIDSRQNGYDWHFIERLSEVRADWASELLERFFTRLSIVAEQNGSSNPFSAYKGREDYAGDIVKKVAENAPYQFLDRFTRILFDVLKKCSKTDDPQPRRDDVWGYQLVDDAYDLEGKFFEALECAMRSIAATRPDEIRAYATAWPYHQYQTSQRLILRSYSENGQYFADDAVEHIASDPASLATGYAGSSRWITREVISASTAHCSADNLARLEGILMDYYPPYECTYQGLRSRGRTQLTLLEGIDVARLSDVASRRLKELRRKFGEDLPLETQPVTGGLVGPPLPESATKRMSDEDWLSAMGTYASYRNQTDPMKGGAVELSHALENLTKENPSRFARLALRMPTNTNPVYFQAVLSGMTGTDLDVDTVVAVCEQLHEVPDQPLGRYITRPLEKWAHLPLPEKTLKMVAWYASEAPDHDSIVGDDDDLLRVGINTVRGAAAISMARLIFDRPENLAFFGPCLEKMVNDESLGVRACVADTVFVALRHDRCLAVNLFLELVETDDRLLSTRFVELFIKYAAQTHYEQLEPVLQRMIASADEEVARAGARQICLASLNVEEALPLANRCAHGEDPLRIGAAEVYAANLKNATHRTSCKEALGEFFNDSHPEVRSAAIACFNQLGGLEFREYQGLIDRFLESSPRQKEFRPVFRALKESICDDPMMLLTVCLSYLKLVGTDITNIATSASIHGRDVTNLILRAYRQSSDADLKGVCLDAIDVLSIRGIFELDNALNEFER